MKRMWHVTISSIEGIPLITRFKTILIPFSKSSEYIVLKVFHL